MCLICIWHEFPMQCCISFVKGEHPHKALGPLYFPTTISNHSWGTVTQQSVKEVNNQIWHSSPIPLLPFICLIRVEKKKKGKKLIKSLRTKHAFVPKKSNRSRKRCRQRAGDGGVGVGALGSRPTLPTASDTRERLWPLDINLSIFADRVHQHTKLWILTCLWSSAAHQSKWAGKQLASSCWNGVCARPFPSAYTRKHLEGPNRPCPACIHTLMFLLI